MAFIAIKHNPFTEVSTKVWDDIEVRAGEAADAAAQAASETFVARAQQRADKVAWPKSTLQQIQTLRDEHGGVSVGIPEGPYGDRAIELEYGTEQFGPQPVLRTTMRRSRKETQQVFEETLAERLFGAG